MFRTKGRNVKLRGALYKKIHKEEPGKPLSRAGQVLFHMRQGGQQPKFTLAPARTLITLPTTAEIRTGSVIYPLIKPYSYANIRYDAKEGVLVYDVIEPKLDERERYMLGKIHEGLVQIIDINLGDIKEKNKMFAFLEKNVDRLIDEYNFSLSQKEYVKIMYYIYRDLVGLNRIEPLLNDPFIEDIGCLPEHERIFVKTDEKIRLMTIKELVELDGDNNTEIKIPSKSVQALSFNPITMKSEYKSIKGFLKKQNKYGYYFDIRTEGGNHINVSPDHPMIVLNKCGIVVKKASEIKDGEYVLRLKNLDTGVSEGVIDLVDELSRINANYRVKGARILLDSAGNASKILGIDGKLISLWKQSNSMPIWAYLKLEKDKSLRKSLKVSIGQGVKNWIPAIIEPSEDLAFFIGLFLAEGYYEDAGISFAFGKHEKELHSLTCDLSRKIFGDCGGKILRLLFEGILGIKGRSEGKRIPDIVYSWNEDMLRNLIRGYFLGDGYIRISDKTKKAVMATSSKELTLGVRYVLYRLGIFTRLDKRNRRFANTWEISLENGASLGKFSHEILGSSTNITCRSSQTELYPSFLFNSNDYNGSKLGLKFAVNSTSELIHKLITGDVHPVKILEITKIEYTKPFYDIEVEDNSNFMHGDFIFTHNCDGVGIHVYVVHQKFGSVRTSVTYTDPKELREFVTKLAERCDRYISYADPLLDGTLPDGTRVQASLASDVTTRGPTFSIRKFREEPLSPVDMIRLNTMSPEMLAYIWFLMENGVNMLIAGGVATGKCISPEDYVQLANGEVMEAENFFETKGMTTSLRPGLVTLDGGMKSYPIPINKFWRNEAPELVVNVATARGTRITTTMEHEFLVLRGGRILRIRADQLTEGDYIAAPRVIKTLGEEQKINLIDYDLDLYVDSYETFDEAVKILKAKFKTHRKICEHLGVDYSRYAMWLRKINSIPLKVLKAACKEAGMDTEKINQNINYIFAKTSNKRISSVKGVSSELAKITGYIIADGMLRGNNARFFNEESCLRAEFMRCSKMVFGIDAKEFKYDRTPYAQISSKAVVEILNKVFGIPRNMAKARIVEVPSILMRARKEDIAALLSALFDCESYVSDKECEIEFSTTSRKLANQVMYLLQRFGILARISERENSYRIRVSGKKNLEAFKEHIGYASEKKKERLENIVRKTTEYHTNADSIPVNHIIKKILAEKKLTISSVAKRCNIRRESLRDILKGKVLPSSGMLERIAPVLPDCTDTRYLKALADSDIFWDKVTSAKKVLNGNHRYMYDVTVDYTHNFVAGTFGGLFISNTSLLNSISFFIPPEAKIVSIEDTREINLPHENWIPGVARTGFTGTGIGEVTMFELLRESFRQNPDYLIVGEIRGKEAYVMFQGMASGHPSISTIHAGSVDDLLKRLQTKPINLSVGLIESLDLVIVMVHAREKGKSARRVKEIVEIESIDIATGTPIVTKSFVWLPADDSFEYRSNSWLLSKVSKEKGIPLNNVISELARRKKFILWLYENNIINMRQIAKYLSLYHRSPEKVSRLLAGEKLREEEYE